MKSTTRQLLEEALNSPKSVRLFEWAKKLRNKSTYRQVKLTPKMWLLPDGRIEALGGNLHDEWLKARPEVAVKFGLTQADLNKDHQGVRVAALKRGFIRIAYERVTGQLTVEGLAKYWVGATKTAVFSLVADNVDAVDRFAINLFNDSATRLVVSKHAELFNYSEREKLDHLPEISETLRFKYVVDKAYS